MNDFPVTSFWHRAGIFLQDMLTAAVSGEARAVASVHTVQRMDQQSLTVRHGAKGETSDSQITQRGNKVCTDKYCITLSEGEVAAEAGLCVVLPCSFTTDDKFNTTEAAWYKCDQPPQERCDKAGVTIFNSSNKEQVQSGFKGRVSLLEPELSLKNCSIIIHDLNVSDSGSYQLRVGGLIDEKKDGWTFIRTTTVKVSGLSQKPTVTVPPLTEGHQTTLTCTAPGLCSGSVPEITWTWRGAGVQDSHITGNITDFKTENLTAVTQRHRSTLTFDPSAEHHGTEVTCKVKFTGNIITEETVTLNVSPEGAEAAWPSAPGEDNVNPKEVEYTDIDVSKLKGKSPTEDKETRRIPETEYAEIKKEKRMKRQDNDREEGEEAAVMIVDDKESEKCVQTEEEGGLSQKPTVTVPPLTEGHQTTLTCTAPGLCSGSVPEITWTWRGAGVQDSHITGNITDFKTENLTVVTQRHRSTLTFDPSAEHNGTEVTCKVKFTGNIITEETVTLNVTYLQKPVITGNTTVKKGDDLNLTCTVESFPPSVLTWTKHGSNKTIENRTANLFITNVTPEDSGRYICSAEHQIRALTAQTDVTVTVTFGPKIFNDSSCVNQSDVLTCVCVSEGVPLPTIRWPLLETHTEYSVTNTVSNHTVTSRIRLSLSAHSTTTFECVSSNDNGQTKHNVSVKNDLYRTADLGPSAVLPWTIAAVSLCLNIICLVIYILYLWNTRKKVKPNQDEGTYMSLAKTDQPSEYDVIAQPLD
ncbi:hypothetical protein Q5P01_011595 [Channa striata]|uniref:Ig-like domain-containing protein n=1 Tax=Channa striata TaxID=64152 RepID=A0AA88MTY1_CHASR|nr:hypothetical protein Q5P01_011595 [Channa striata]